MKIAGKTNLEVNLSYVGVSEKELSDSFHLEENGMQTHITSAGVSINFDKAKVDGSKIIMSGSGEVMNVSMKSAIRFSTLNGICKVLECQPGDILEYEEE